MSDDSSDNETTLHKKYPDSVQPGIPRLGELKDGWTRIRIGELFEETSRPIKMDDDENYTLVTVKRSRGGAILRGIKKGREISVKSQYIVNEGDFLISKRQIVHGACALVPKELDGAIVSNEYSVLNCNEKLDSTFLSFLSHSQYFQQTCFHSSIGVHIEKMIFKLPEWFSWKIDIPSLPEQQKIAAFLTTVDEKISKLRRKQELLQTYKRGVMQKLFSQELRFKREDGSRFPDWEEKTLEEIADKNVRWSFTGGPFGSNLKAEDYTEGGIRIIQLQNIGDGVFNDDYKIYTSKEKADELLSCNIYGGEIILAKMGDPVARACRIPDYETRCLMASDGIRFVPETKLYDKDFVFFSLNTRTFRETAFNLGTGSTRKRIGLGDLRIVKLPVPILEEQQKIAAFLTAIDAKIEAVSKQVSLVERFKKGLLQQMFV